MTGDQCHSASVAATATWQRRVALASLGSDAVVPAGVGVIDEASQVVEELSEGHVAGLVDGVVEQGGPPQGGVSPKQHAVDAGQTLLRGVGGLQVVLPAPVAAAPRLVAVVEAAEVMCTWERVGGRGGGRRPSGLANIDQLGTHVLE